VGSGVRNVKFQVGANPNQVINIGLKDFSYNLGVPAVASESKYTLGDLSGKKDFGFTITEITTDLTAGTATEGARTGGAITFSLTRAIAGATMTEEELVDFETKMNKAITDATGYSNVTVSRVGNDIYVNDAEGRTLVTGALTGAASGGTLAALSGVTGSIVTDGTIATPGAGPASTAVFSGSARLNDTQIKTQSGANQAIARLDNAMANVDHELATFGSVMNRLTFAGDNLTNVSQNTQQSRSRVLDTDYAAATTELARTQIIQQAGMAMLAQANQQPQTVLSLLQ
jgi:flagellin